MNRQPTDSTRRDIPTNVPAWRSWLVPVLLFLLSLGVLLRTVVPTLYTLDSAEFVIGAEALGIVHAPGYPLYLTLLHLWLKLPLGDAGYAGNLFSALALALTTPLLYLTLRRITRTTGVALSVTLLFVWSYYVWTVGLFAEVYAPQVLTLTLAGALLARLADPDSNSLATTNGATLPLLIGLAYGLAVAMHPASILFAPGVALCFLLRRVPWRWSLLAAALAALIALVTLLYFPIRFAADPALNLAGAYDAAGTFLPRDLSTPEGILWLVSGQQFESLFFAEGVLPSPGQLGEVLTLFAGNWLGFGLVLGLYGLFVWAQARRGVLWAWLALFGPYTFFYATYGAGDKALMFGPSLLLWTAPLAVGLREIMRQIAPRWRAALLIALPVLALLVNFPLLDLSGDTSVRERSELFMAAAPPEAVVFARWYDITPLEYLHIVEGARPDLRLYNLFLFPRASLRAYVESLLAAGETVWLVDVDAATWLPGVNFTEIALTPDDPGVPGFAVWAAEAP